jgi:hypothetical protein
VQFHRTEYVRWTSHIDRRTDALASVTLPLQPDVCKFPQVWTQRARMARGDMSLGRHLDFVTAGERTTALGV